MECNSKKGCSADEMDRKCKERASCTSYFGGRVSRNRGSVSCTPGYKAVTHVCTPMVMTNGNASWIADPTKTACDYHNGRWQQPRHCVRSAVAASRVPVFFLSSDDPYIELQRITKGSKDFGLTSKQQRVMGLSLTIVGAIIFGLVIAFAMWLRRRLFGNREHKARLYGAFGRQVPQDDYRPMPVNQAPGSSYQQMPQQTGFPQQQQQQQYFQQPQLQQPMQQQPYSQPQPQSYDPYATKPQNQYGNVSV